MTLAGALALSACGGDDDDSAASMELAATDQDAMEAPTATVTEGGDIVRSAETSADAAEVADTAEAGNTGFDFGAIGRDVIIEMRVLMSSDDIQRTVAAITANASSLGGGVGSSDVDFGDPAIPTSGYAILVVKVPPVSVDRLLSGLDDAGTVQSINQSAQDVTDQLVDLDVRISNARQSVTNVREFMDRTEDLSELVALEGELTRRQTELERLEAQQRNLSDRVALSTITIEVRPTASVPEPVEDEPDTIGGAFERGWEIFGAFLFAIVYLIAVTLPFLALGMVGVGIAWALMRRRVRSSRDIGRSAPADVDDPVGANDETDPVEISEDETATPVG